MTHTADDETSACFDSFSNSTNDMATSVYDAFTGCERYAADIGKDAAGLSDSTVLGADASNDFSQLWLRERTPYSLSGWKRSFKEREPSLPPFGGSTGSSKWVTSKGVMFCKSIGPVPSTVDVPTLSQSWISNANLAAARDGTKVSKLSSQTGASVFFLVSVLCTR